MEYLCGIKAFLITFFFTACWIWTVLLVYQLRCAMIFRQLRLQLIHMHLITWFIASCVSLLPLSMTTLGVDDVLNGETPCTYRGNPVVSFYRAVRLKLTVQASRAANRYIGFSFIWVLSHLPALDVLSELGLISAVSYSFRLRVEERYRCDQASPGCRQYALT